MMIFTNILTVFYLIILGVITVFVAWNVWESRKFTEKTIGAIALIMFILRLLLIK